MDRAQQLTEFLQTRRARLSPEEAGATTFGGRRRVPGLRREELALLAGVSVDYYTRLEQGRARNVSADILDAVARALHLDADETAHLHNLAQPTARKRPARRQQVGPEMRQALDALTTVPAYLIGRRLDVLAWNDLARVLVADFPALPAAERNMARLVFLDDAARDLYPDWESKARDTVANLRFDAGRHPDDPLLAELVGELSLHSADFRRLWAGHGVRGKTRGRKRFAHPRAGELALDYVAMSAPDDPDLTMMIYSAPAGSDAATALQLLATLTAPADPVALPVAGTP
ncbi:MULTISPECIES: helix-turn-helix domain-containing protein [Amycolatopsis]|uniref:Helix-turn-helix transcriptional regulator n=1 Tax=Amycolatopsis thermalba TaxID=944492 RepID=A0ABY4NM94_9PSEU|nr:MULTISPECIES: helix-turn-helix transcriptional regulator [Amycolatopsis]OXM74719.1 transcriptional regulator [Amycolatopsis sp. KNN50.9b]UQS21599.1 helix-turn-helix transcriptional regulator [Amycolatopsis thermalba]